MSDESVDLNLIARQLKRVLDEQARQRDDMTVMMAMLQRMDGAITGLTAQLAGLTNEVRAEHSRYSRLDRCMRDLEAENG